MNKRLSMDNKEILWKISEGNLQAFESLFLEYQPKLVAFIDKFISDHEQARDMASDIFLEIWKKRHGLRKVRCFSAYLFRMAHFQVYNYYDHQHVIQRYRNESRFRHTDDPGPENGLFAAQLEDLFVNEISKMPRKRRQVFMMSRFEGLENDEIALRLHIDKRTVQNQLSLCLQSLRKIVLAVLAVIFI